MVFFESDIATELTNRRKSRSISLLGFDNTVVVVGVAIVVVDPVVDVDAVVVKTPWL